MPAATKTVEFSPSLANAIYDIAYQWADDARAELDDLDLTSAAGTLAEAAKLEELAKCIEAGDVDGAIEALGQIDDARDALPAGACDVIESAQYE